MNHRIVTNARQPAPLAGYVPEAERYPLMTSRGAAAAAGPASDNYGWDKVMRAVAPERFAQADEQHRSKRLGLEPVADPRLG